MLDFYADPRVKLLYQHNLCHLANRVSSRSGAKYKDRRGRGAGGRRPGAGSGGASLWVRLSVGGRSPVPPRRLGAQPQAWGFCLPGLQGGCPALFTPR